MSRYDFYEFFPPALAMVALIAGLFALAYELDKASCASKARALGVASSWGPLQDCFVEARPGKWVPLNSYRAQDALEDGK